MIPDFENNNVLGIAKETFISLAVCYYTWKIMEVDLQSK